LLKSISKNISKAITMFVVKCEGVSVTDSSAYQISTNPTQAQILNINIVNIIWYLEDLVWNLMSEYETTEAGDFLQSSCEVFVALT
jgi:hypothetical protein